MVTLTSAKLSYRSSPGLTFWKLPDLAPSKISSIQSTTFQASVGALGHQQGERERSCLMNPQPTSDCLALAQDCPKISITAHTPLPGLPARCSHRSDPIPTPTLLCQTVLDEGGNLGLPFIVCSWEVSCIYNFLACPKNTHQSVLGALLSL